MALSALLATLLCTVVLPLLLFLVAVKLWEVYLARGADPSCASPLPPGSMGLPFIGETLQLLLQVRLSVSLSERAVAVRGWFDHVPRWFQRRKFLRMKRQKYGYIYRTHLFGSPTVRVTGADNVRQILLGEHRLVSAQWPASVRTILGSDTLSNMHGSQHRTKKKVSLQVVHFVFFWEVRLLLFSSIMSISSV